MQTKPKTKTEKRAALAIVIIVILYVMAAAFLAWENTKNTKQPQPIKTATWPR